MDYRRFQSQAQLACYTNERDAIREYDATTPITTNLMGTFKDLDYFEWAKEMDVVSWDNYPGMDTPPSFTAMCHDLMRGIGGNKPFMLMEQTPNQQNWFPFCKVKQPGEVRKLSWQAVAHGADTVRFFQMKQSLGGCERFHGAVIAHDGTEESRVFKETAALGEELDRIGRRIMGSRIESRVAIMFDWQSYWSLEGCVGPTTGFNYPNEVHRFYRALWRRNVPVDMIASTTPLARLVVGHLAVGFVRIEAEQPHDAVRVLADQPDDRLTHFGEHMDGRHHGTRDLLVELHGDTLRHQFGNDDRAIRDDQCQRDGGQGSGDVMRHTPVFDDRHDIRGD